MAEVGQPRVRDPEDYFNNIAELHQGLTNQMYSINQTKTYFDDQIQQTSDSNISDLIAQCKEYAVSTCAATAETIHDLGMDISCLLSYQASRVQNLTLRINAVNITMKTHELTTSIAYSREVSYLRSHIPRRLKLQRLQESQTNIALNAKYDHKPIDLDALSNVHEEDFMMNIPTRDHSYSVAASFQPTKRINIPTSIDEKQWKKNVVMASPTSVHTQLNAPKDEDFFTKTHIPPAPKTQLPTLPTVGFSPASTPTSTNSQAAFPPAPTQLPVSSSAAAAPSPPPPQPQSQPYSQPEEQLYSHQPPPPASPSYDANQNTAPPPPAPSTSFDAHTHIAPPPPSTSFDSIPLTQTPSSHAPPPPPSESFSSYEQPQPPPPQDDPYSQQPPPPSADYYGQYESQPPPQDDQYGQQQEYGQQEYGQQDYEQQQGGYEQPADQQAYYDEYGRWVVPVAYWDDNSQMTIEPGFYDQEGNYLGGFE